jgi:dCMP deaminase
MKSRYITAYMKAAYVFADLSYCVRRKVGCVVVKNDTIISIGYNGPPAGWCNDCEGEDGLTLPYVLHAEENALIKLTKSHESAEGAVMLVTTAPCLPCAKLLAEIGLKEIYYAEQYRGPEGLDHLQARGIPVTQVKQ